MDSTTREIDCALIQDLLRTYPTEMTVVIEMLREIEEPPCQELAA